jgi:hypothetical protein
LTGEFEVDVADVVPAAVPVNPAGGFAGRGKGGGRQVDVAGGAAAMPAGNPDEVFVGCGALVDGFEDKLELAAGVDVGATSCVTLELFCLLSTGLREGGLSDVLEVA